MASSNLRSRTNIPPTNNNDPSPPPTAKPTPHPKPKSTPLAFDDEGPTHLTLLDILRILAGLLLLSTTLSYFITGNSLIWNLNAPFLRPARIKGWLRGPLSLTDAQLSLYNGTDPSLPILLAVNGTIYDVSASPQYYGPGGMYGFFAGRDATRAFVTGCFESDLNGDLRGVEEMFMSADLSEEGGKENKEGGGRGKGEREGEGKGFTKEEGLTKEEKREWKLRREREGRLARKKVEETVMGWERMFDGGKGGKYFRVGRVDRGRGSGWEGWGEVKGLCEKARKGRPRRTAEEVG